MTWIEGIVHVIIPVITTLNVRITKGDDEIKFGNHAKIEWHK